MSQICSVLHTKHYSFTLSLLLLFHHVEVAMQLKRIEISGFRGIKRLSLSFDELTVLIGENAWGKSSLLDALDVALSPNATFHSFHFDDFHVDYSAGHAKMSHLNIILYWQEDFPGEHKARRYKSFAPVWVNHKDDCKALFYQITSSVSGDKITTKRRISRQFMESLFIVKTMINSRNNSWCCTPL